MWEGAECVGGVVLIIIIIVAYVSFYDCLSYYFTRGRISNYS